ncbi:MAG: hypothetical protein AVDCRST_MAG25-2205, partial [uncultured Rubrobacteraceae bacterium]
GPNRGLREAHGDALPLAGGDPRRHRRCREYPRRQGRGARQDGARRRASRL